jgi:hypothetical protein
MPDPITFISTTWRGLPSSRGVKGRLTSMAHPSDQTGEFDSLAGAEFIAAIAGDAFFLI